MIRLHWQYEVHAIQQQVELVHCVPFGWILEHIGCLVGTVLVGIVLVALEQPDFFF